MNSKLVKELVDFFNEVKCPAPPARSIIITEQDKGAVLKELHLSRTSGDLEQLPSGICKGLWNGLHRCDNDCDGIVLLPNACGGDPQLLLVELKSTLSEWSLFKAIQQVVISLLKMHTLFSLCSSYNGILSPVEVLICCSDNSNLMNRTKTLTEHDGHLSSAQELYRSWLLREGARTKLLLRDVLREIDWAKGWSIPASLLNLELVIQILCSEGEKAIEHGL